MRGFALITWIRHHWDKILEHVAALSVVHVLSLLAVAAAGALAWVAALVPEDFSLTCGPALPGTGAGLVAFVAIALLAIVYVLIRRGKNLPAFAVGALLAFTACSVLSISTYICLDGLLAARHHFIHVALANAFFFLLVCTTWYLIKSRGMIARLGLVASKTPQLDGEAPDHFYRAAVTRNFAREIEEAKAVSILVCTGNRTFGELGTHPEECGWLKEMLTRAPLEPNNRRVTILMLDPSSQAAAERARVLGRPLDRYQDLICQGVRVCAELRRVLPNLHCFLYQRPPIWKLVITPGHVWQQSYPRANALHASDVNIYERNGKGLTDALVREFEELAREAKQVDLERVDPSMPLTLPMLRDASSRGSGRHTVDNEYLG